MTFPDYKKLARAAIAAAKAHLEADIDSGLFYAALELRFAIEAVTYSRAVEYQEFIPQELYLRWQPKALMEGLIEISPAIGHSSRTIVRKQNKEGVISANDKVVLDAHEIVLSLKEIKEHYSAIGNYLHLPSLENARDGKLRDLGSLKKRCIKIIGAVETVLSSTFRFRPEATALLDACLRSDCGLPIVRKFIGTKEAYKTTCPHCEVPYIIEEDDSGGFVWRTVQISVECANVECDHLSKVYEDELKAGTWWKCEKCAHRNEIVLRVADADADADADATGLS